MKVSVIIPVYNAEQYLKKCVDSILEQTYSDIELLLINDGSVDSSGEICDSYAEKDCRIRVIHMQNNGVSVARNTGLEHATGEFSVFVDSDDWLHPEAISKMISIEQETHADLVTCNYVSVTKHGEILNTVHDAIYSDDEIGKKLLVLCNENGRTSGNKLFRNKIIQENSIRFPMGIPVGEDAMFSASYMGFCKKIVICSDVTYFYNKLRTDNAMSKIRPEYYCYQANIFEVYKEIAERKLTGKEKENEIAALAAFFCAEAIHYHLFYTLLKSTQKNKILDIIEYYRAYLRLEQPICGDKLVREEFQLLLDGNVNKFIRTWIARQKKTNGKMYYKSYLKLLATKLGLIKLLKK